MQTAVPRKTLEERVSVLEKTAREIRFHIVDMVYTAQSGHCGGSLSAADIVTALYFDQMNIDPADPKLKNRDRFVLSKGHACPVWYAALALKGFFPIKELKTLRQFESILQGHPVIKTPGVDMTTGSLGQGISMAVGMALEAKMIREDYRVYAVLGDGELDEGQVWEAAAAAAKYGLDNLIAIVDSNGLQNDGFTSDIMPMGPIDRKFEAFNWHVLTVDGHDMKSVVQVLEKARTLTGKPVCIVAKTVKGKGVSFMENQRGWHGKAPNDAEYAQAVKEIRGESR